jgi:uncharacterized membrane protein YidH (DUF202 family)
MTKPLIKSIVLYLILVSIIIMAKPRIFYYDNEKTKLKPWNLYFDTNSINDLLSLHLVIVILAILSFLSFN